MVMLPNFWNYVTITERLMVVLSLTSILCLIMLQQEYKIQTKYIAYICVFIFGFHTFRASRMDLHGVFYRNSYQEIQKGVITYQVFYYSILTHGDIQMSL